MWLMTFRRSFLFLLMTDFLLAAGSFRWTFPPPAWTPTDGDDVRTVNFTVLNGSTNVALRWNYTLGSGETLALTQWTIDESDLGFLSTVPAATVFAQFGDRFIISTSEVATVIIKNVADINDATFECKVTTSVGSWKYKISVEITVETSLTSYTGDQTVTEGADLSLFCNATGKPTPNIIWTRVWENGTDGEQVFHGNPWVTVNISRTATGTYRCTADNGIGNPVNHSLYVNVTYKPDNVAIVTNTTENKDCSDLWVNFTCISSEANPPAYNYLLSDDEDGFSFSKSGTWIKKISRGGKSIYNCTAYQLVGNVTSTNNITLTVNVPLVVGQTENKTVHEGDNAKLYCNMSGIPDPTFIWTKVQDGGYNAEEGKLLSITNITRAQAGKYKCNANNTCGEKSTVAYVDVQYKPENVRLTTNTTSKVCTGVVINFTCTAEANPAVHTYLLFENDTVIKNMGISGTWIKTMENSGQFVFRCEANNSIQGNQTSDDTILTVDVPAFVEHVKNILNVTEGENVEEYCNVTAGIPDPTVMWTNVKTGKDIKENLLNITNINRTQAGDYRCIANNTCGEASTVVNINVQYKPENVHLTTNTTSKVCTGVVINFTCTAEANPPVHTYLLYKNDTVIENMGISGTWIKAMKNAGQFVYRCEANNSIHWQEIQTSDDTILTVSVPASVEQVKNILNVREGENVEEYCNVTAGIPDPTFMWTNVKTGEHIKENLLNITNINRAQAGEYRCTANNTCGEASTVMNINVQFAPFVTDGNPTQKNCPISCPVNGNPLHNFTWYKGNDSSTKISNVNTKQLPESVCNSGLYTCFTENHLGNVTVTVKVVIVENPVPTTSSIPTTKENPVPTTSSIPTTKESTMHVRMKINASCDQKSDVEKKVPRLACQVTKPMGCVTAKALDSRPGCVILDFEMKFNQSVVVGEVLNVLKTAAKNDSFAGFQVDPKSIAQISPPTTGTSSTKESGCSGFFRNEDCKIKLVLVIVIAVAGLMVICIIVGVIAWWVHKRRKCRKDTRVHHSTSEEQPFSRANSTPGDDNSNSQVNNGYAEAGPLPSKMTDTAQHLGASSPAAVPTYAVVDKSAKKGKKKDKNVEEQKPQAEPPQYSVVDKSKKKKKKKEEPEATYAQVDMSKKSKKKPKAGEVLYADLGDFHQMQELPNVSTSPKALPPIKKPEAYVETQYADITQFLKGDVTLPDSSNSQGPAGGTQAAAVPENQESQEPGTSAKETSKASNPGGDGGPDHETNF